MNAEVVGSSLTVHHLPFHLFNMATIARGTFFNLGGINEISLRLPEGKVSDSYVALAEYLANIFESANFLLMIVDRDLVGLSFQEICD